MISLLGISRYFGRPTSIYDPSRVSLSLLFFTPRRLRSWTKNEFGLRHGTKHNGCFSHASSACFRAGLKLPCKHGMAFLGSLTRRRYRRWGLCVRKKPSSTPWGLVGFDDQNKKVMGVWLGAEDDSSISNGVRGSKADARSCYGAWWGLGVKR